VTHRWLIGNVLGIPKAQERHWGFYIVAPWQVTRIEEIAESPREALAQWYPWINSGTSYRKFAWTGCIRLLCIPRRMPMID
jgi:hypothetical protein